ncbi:MAG: GAS domain-containing protein [Planctomycetota bacterium]|jgi:hypothetical protein
MFTKTIRSTLLLAACGWVMILAAPAWAADPPAGSSTTETELRKQIERMRLEISSLREQLSRAEAKIANRQKHIAGQAPDKQQAYERYKAALTSAESEQKAVELQRQRVEQSRLVLQRTMRVVTETVDERNRAIAAEQLAAATAPRVYIQQYGSPQPYSVNRSGYSGYGVTSSAACACGAYGYHTCNYNYGYRNYGYGIYYGSGGTTVRVGGVPYRPTRHGFHGTKPISVQNPYMTSHVKRPSPVPQLQPTAPFRRTPGTNNLFPTKRSSSFVTSPSRRGGSHTSRGSR